MKFIIQLITLILLVFYATTLPAQNASSSYINQIPIAQNLPPNNVKTEKKTVTFNDAQYEGDVNPQGEPHGNGVMTYNTGEQYIGAFVNGKRQGYGVYKFVNGDRYEGNFYNNVRHGEGSYTLANGTAHTGIFEKNEYLGKTVLTINFDNEIVKYEGAIVVGTTGKLIPHEKTKGKMELPNKWVYEGEMSYAMMHGNGKQFIYAEKKTIEGTFDMGQLHGLARIMFANGDIAERVYNHGYFQREISYKSAKYNSTRYDTDDD